MFRKRLSNEKRAYQFVENVFLMHMNCNQSLILDALDFGQIGGRDGNQRVKNVQKVLIGVLHELFVVFGVVQRFFGLFGPNHLNTKQPNLQVSKELFIRIK